MEGEKILAEDELSKVSGGAWAEPGDRVKVSGSLYQTSYGEGYSGLHSRNLVIQRYIKGRAAPYQLKTNVGWDKESAIVGECGRSKSGTVSGEENVGGVCGFNFDSTNQSKTIAPSHF